MLPIFSIDEWLFAQQGDGVVDTSKFKQINQQKKKKGGQAHY